MRTAPDAYIVDAVRTPRGRGKAEVGALSGLTPLWLLRGVLQGLQRRLGALSPGKLAYATWGLARLGRHCSPELGNQLAAAAASKRVNTDMSALSA
jgi:acetyl-CoA C-acetyltransferase